MVSSPSLLQGALWPHGYQPLSCFPSKEAREPAHTLNLSLQTEPSIFLKFSLFPRKVKRQKTLSTLLLNLALYFFPCLRWQYWEECAMLGASTSSLPIHSAGTFWNLPFSPNIPLKSPSLLLMWNIMTLLQSLWSLTLLIPWICIEFHLTPEHCTLNIFLSWYLLSNILLHYRRVWCRKK